MKLTFDFSGFDMLISRMGAQQSSWRLVGADIAEREPLRIALESGKEITLDQVTHKGGLLEHEGEQVLLYIKDTRASRETLLNSPEHSRRFHLAECSTLQTMRRNKRFSRYHVAKRLDGKFNCTWYNEESREYGEVLAELKVCKNCLKEINWEDYSSSSSEAQNSIWQNFDIPNFLRLYETVFYSKPNRGEDFPVTPTYVQRWSEISRNYRSAKLWRCDRCNVNLSEHRNLLHTHHINGDLGDNSPSNLEALCVVCHADEPHHGRVSYTPTEKATIDSLRLLSK